MHWTLKTRILNVAKGQIKDYINEIIEVISHEKSIIENSDDITPTNNANLNNILIDNSILINESQSQSQLCQSKEDFSQLSNDQKLDQLFYQVLNLTSKVQNNTEIINNNLIKSKISNNSNEAILKSTRNYEQNHNFYKTQSNTRYHKNYRSNQNGYQKW